MLENSNMEKLENYKNTILGSRDTGKTTLNDSLQNNKQKKRCFRGEIYQADMGKVGIGEQDSEQRGVRPVIIVQNDIGNTYSPTVIVVAITSVIDKAKLPTHVELSAIECGLEKNSVVLSEQIRTLDKKKLLWKIGTLSEEYMEKVDKTLLSSLALDNKKYEQENRKQQEERKNKEEYNNYVHKIDNKVAEIKTLDRSIKRCLDKNIELTHPYILEMLEDRQNQLTYLRKMCNNIGLEINRVYDMNSGVVNNELREVCGL
jgi:mRNA interferase MazF